MHSQTGIALGSIAISKQAKATYRPGDIHMLLPFTNGFMMKPFHCINIMFRTQTYTLHKPGDIHILLPATGKAEAKQYTKTCS